MFNLEVLMERFVQDRPEMTGTNVWRRFVVYLGIEGKAYVGAGRTEHEADRAAKARALRGTPTKTLAQVAVDALREHGIEVKK